MLTLIFGAIPDWGFHRIMYFVATFLLAAAFYFLIEMPSHLAARYVGKLVAKA